MNKENWVSIFKEIGLTKEQMIKWHQVFEKRYSGDHTRFLQWLGLDENEIRNIKNL